MKKIIALTTLVAAGAVSAQTTSTKEISVSQKKIQDRFSFWYYGNIEKARVDSNESAGPDTEFVNYLNTGFELSNNWTANLTIRTLNTDAEGSRNETLDPRLGLDRDFKDSMLTKLRGQVELPVSAATMANEEKIAKLKLWANTENKIDDLNTITSVSIFNNTFYNKAQTTDEGDPSSKYDLDSYITWANTALSEDIVPSLTLNAGLDHIGGKSNIATTMDYKMTAGVSFDVLEISLTPYLTHDPTRIKALNQSTIGIEIFKSL